MHYVILSTIALFGATTTAYADDNVDVETKQIEHVTTKERSQQPLSWDDTLSWDDPRYREQQVMLGGD